MEQKSFKERQRENKEPQQFALYKGVKGKFGALRINLKKAYTDQNKDSGCVFLDMAPAVAPNVYDWDNGKVIMALSVTDIGKIITYLRAPGHHMFDKTDNKLKIFHDRGAGTASRGKDKTTLEISKYPDKMVFFVSIYQERNGEKRQATVTVSPDEALVLGTLLQEAIPLMEGWAPVSDVEKMNLIERKLDYLHTQLKEVVSLLKPQN
jgi:hypothetical protein